MSCLSLVWTFAGAGEILHEGEIDLKIKHKVLFCLTYLLLLTSRLLAICYFILSYRGWIFVVLIPPSLIISLADCILRCRSECDWRCRLLFVFFLSLHSIRDDLSAPLDADDPASRRKQLKRIQWLSHIMFIVENFAMILLFYNHSKSSNIWFALPLTVYVCSASILGSVMRLAHFGFLLKSRVAPETNVTNEEVEAAALAIQQELMNAYDFVQAYQLAHGRWVTHKGDPPGVLRHENDGGARWKCSDTPKRYRNPFVGVPSNSFSPLRGTNSEITN